MTHVGVFSQMFRNILVEISHHGFGHASQMGLILNEFCKLFENQNRPRILVLSKVPEWYLRERLKFPFELIAQPSDPGLIMKNILDVDLEKTWTAYKEQARNWNALVEEKKSLLQNHKIDIVLSNVGYISLQAAAELDIPRIAMCSLSWAQVIESYFADEKHFHEIRDQILSAYNQSPLFVELLPNEPLKGLKNSRRLGPIGRRGQNFRKSLQQQDPWFFSQQVGVVSLGGGNYPMQLQNWSQPGCVLLVPDNAEIGDNPNLKYSSSLKMEFSDLIESCDFVVAKPGYGLFSEIAFAKKPCFYVGRERWPEQTALVEWLRKYVPIAAVTAADICSGNYPLHRLDSTHLTGESVLSETPQVAQIIYEEALRAARFSRN